MLVWILFMLMTKGECINLLHDQFVLDFSQIDNVSKLMNTARGEDKSACLQFFNNGSVVAVKDALNIRMEKEEEQIQPQETETKQEPKQNRFQASVESVDFSNINTPEQVLNLL